MVTKVSQKRDVGFVANRLAAFSIASFLYDVYIVQVFTGGRHTAIVRWTRN